MHLEATLASIVNVISTMTLGSEQIATYCRLWPFCMHRRVHVYVHDYKGRGIVSYLTCIWELFQIAIWSFVKKNKLISVLQQLHFSVGIHIAGFSPYIYTFSKCVLSLFPSSKLKISFYVYFIHFISILSSLLWQVGIWKSPKHSFNSKFCNIYSVDMIMSVCMSSGLSILIYLPSCYHPRSEGVA